MKINMLGLCFVYALSLFGISSAASAESLSPGIAKAKTAHHHSTARHKTSHHLAQRAIPRQQVEGPPAIQVALAEQAPAPAPPAENTTRSTFQQPKMTDYGFVSIQEPMFRGGDTNVFVKPPCEIVKKFPLSMFPMFGMMNSVREKVMDAAFDKFNAGQQHLKLQQVCT